MAEEPVHYEVFIRRDALAGWTLDLATEARADALQAAEEALRDRRAVGVRVSRESRREGGDYLSVVILSKGELTPPRPRVRAPHAMDAPLCVAPPNLYTLHARERIGRLLEGWLNRQGVTPFELLHRPDLVERLDAAGLELQHAIQKIAIPEAQATGASVHEVIRHYQKLVEAAVARLLGDARRHTFPALERDGLDAALRRAREASDPGYVLGAAVAAALAGRQGWAAKLSRLLDLADEAQGRPDRPLLLQVLEQPLSEILGARAALPEFLDGSSDLGRYLGLMARLVAPEAAHALDASDPALARAIPATTPQIARLARALAEPGLEEARHALARRILAELHGPRRLHPSDPTAEILTLRALARLLVLSPGAASPEAVQGAFVNRSGRLVTADFVQSYVERCGGGALGEAQALVRLAENVVGLANKRAAGAYLKAAVGGLRLEREMRAGGEAASAKLAHLADLVHALPRTGLASEDQAEVIAALGHVADEVEAAGHLVAGIGRSGAAAERRLTLLLRLAGGEAAPPGPAAQRARAEALRLIRDPAVRAELAAAAPAEVERMRLMLHTAGLAA